MNLMKLQHYYIISASEDEISILYIEFIACLIGNKLCLHCEAHSVNTVWDSNEYWLCK